MAELIRHEIASVRGVSLEFVLRVAAGVQPQPRRDGRWPTGKQFRSCAAKPHHLYSYSLGSPVRHNAARHRFTSHETLQHNLIAALQIGLHTTQPYVLQAVQALQNIVHATPRSRQERVFAPSGASGLR